jgi:hypothetical protein
MLKNESEVSLNNVIQVLTNTVDLDFLTDIQKNVIEKADILLETGKGRLRVRK